MANRWQENEAQAEIEIEIEIEIISRSAANTAQL